MCVRCVPALVLLGACSGTVDDRVDLLPPGGRDAGSADAGFADASVADAGVVTGTPIPEVDPTIAFGASLVGEISVRTALLQNLGDAPFSVRGVAVVPSNEAFFVDIATAQITPGGAAPVTARFIPPELGAYEARARITFTDPALAPLVVTLSGEGSVPVLGATQTTFVFGNVVVGQTATLGFVLGNTGGLDATVTFVDEQNVRLCSDTSNPAVFCVRVIDRMVAPDGSFSLAAGETTEVEAEFTPSIAGTRERGAFGLSACRSPACTLPFRLDGLGVGGNFTGAGD
ncbi:MAG: choice-of-anchor D domain-containing protein [Deltaproteobacteria bacterium]